MPKPKKQKKHSPTHESTSYLDGLFMEFSEQSIKYNHLTGELLSLEARIELAEKTLSLTRDHFAMAIAKTQDAAPMKWAKVLKSVRFVGVRLADACAKCLEEHKKMAEQLSKK